VGRITLAHEELQREVEASPLLGVDLEPRIGELADALRAAKVHHSTVKSLRDRQLRGLAAAIRAHGRTIAAVLDPTAREAIRTIAEKAGTKTIAPGLPADLVAATVRLAPLLVPLEAAIAQACLPIVKEVRDQEQRRSGAYDFDGIIAGVADAVEAPGGDLLIRALRARYRYALIDEFQDTDDRQWDVFRKVFFESQSDHHTYLIGDPKQAIYGFRGADVRAYIAATGAIKAKGSEPVVLKENHRSTSALIEACNWIFDQTDEAPFFSSGDIKYGEPVRAGKSFAARNADGTPSLPVHVLEVEPRGDKLGMPELRRGLARRIAREVRDVLSGPGSLIFGEEGAEKPIESSDVFVLTATNTDAERVIAALRAEGIRGALYKQEGLFQTAEARAVRDLLAVVADRKPRNRAWITPFFAVPLQSLPDLAELSPEHPLCRRLDDWSELAASGRFESLFARILDESGIILRELFFKDDERALTNYLHLFEILLELARSTGAGLPELVATLDGYILGTRQPATEDGNIQRLESDRSAVQVMTIHKSKGLEAAVVFLYGGFSGRKADGYQEYHEGRVRVLDFDPSDESQALAERERDEEQQRLYYVALTRAKARLYLPLVPPAHWSGQWKGGYRGVNERLARVLARPEARRLFAIRKFRDEPPRPEGARTGQGVPAALPETWIPAGQDLEIASPRGDLAALRERHRPYVVTSYSRMKPAWAGDAAIEPDERYQEPDAESNPDALPEGSLPGGRGAGTLLHEILEKVSFEATAAAANLDAWRRVDSVAQLIDGALTRSGIGTDHRPEVESIVYRALTAAIPICHSDTIPGFCRCRRELREMEFLFPHPEPSHPRLSDLKPARLVIERGFVKGFVDLVVEHRGLVYAVDWKSDVLASYDSASVAKCVREHYDIQADLYSLALVRALSVRTEAAYEARYGGMFYVFLRGLRQGESESVGVHFLRPPWGDILKYEQDLVRFGERSSGVSQ
jgi:exodeoxyribonuclease V beta subunit